ncbi:MAG: type II secretion system F family protein [Bifidobacteriaceae bacterium]|nr:type II secretion system F family protein [Bifidobacteriaceae bacterium]
MQPAKCTYQPSNTTIIEIIRVAIAQGASIPTAIASLARAMPYSILSRDLTAVSEKILKGYSWDDSWLSSSIQSENRAIVHCLYNALTGSWKQGASPNSMLQNLSERLDMQEKLSIEKSATALSVKLLMPIGLCFLPSFVVIGVIPTVMSFV